MTSTCKIDKGRTSCSTHTATWGLRWRSVMMHREGWCIIQHTKSVHSSKAEAYARFERMKRHECRRQARRVPSRALGHNLKSWCFDMSFDMCLWSSIHLYKRWKLTKVDINWKIDERYTGPYDNSSKWHPLEKWKCLKM